jgi:hypothetical protein
MDVHGLDGILTFNGAHFARYRGIAILRPADVAEGTHPRP